MWQQPSIVVAVLQELGQRGHRLLVDDIGDLRVVSPDRRGWWQWLRRKVPITHFALQLQGHSMLLLGGPSANVYWHVARFDLNDPTFIDRLESVIMAMVVLDQLLAISHPTKSA